ncbi:MAG: UDP-N-acetylmuramoyl-tripeptide--D-alanyl-D-alanine ligase [Candidatus Paceibacterota bacterium]
MKNFFKKIVTKILIFEAKLVLKKYNPKIVAITGSVGKTSTKDAVYTVLSQFAHVRKSDKSYNSQIGLPLTILGIPNAWNDPIKWIGNLLQGLWLIVYPHAYPKWLVLEVGVGKPGDMAETASWLSTDVVILTTIPEIPAHIEFFNSRKHLVEEKATLIKTLKRSGTLILNRDNETVFELKNKTKSVVVTFGFDKEATLSGGEVNIYYENNAPKGITFRVDEGGKSLPVVMEGVFGKNHVYVALAALAVAHSVNANILEAIDALRPHATPPGRMKVLAGIKDTIIIDDSYNSSPVALEAALMTLGEIKAQRAVAVLGDMLELGKHTEEEHKKAGKMAKEKATILIAVGPRAQYIADGALEAGMAQGDVYTFQNSKEAAVFVYDFIAPGDVVLVKGSQGVRMERVVSEILKDQANKAKLIVRQEDEWLKKD